MATVVFDAYPKEDFDGFLAELLLEVPELPDEIMMNYVRNAAIEFAERTHLLKRDIKLCLQPCVPNYILEAPDCMRIVAVQSICRTGDCSGQVTRLTQRPCHVGCFGTYAWWEKPDILWFRPAPTTPQEATITVSVAPAFDACDVDAILLHEHKAAIQAGTRALIYNIPRRAWSSPSHATEQRQEFDRRIAAAGVERLLGGNTGTVRMQTLFNRRSGR